MTKKIEWIAILQGLTIIMVVVSHVRLLNIETGRDYPFVYMAFKWFYPFYLQVFFFVSGGLLYLTRFSRGMTIKSIYKDKFRRLVIPFIFFTLLGCLAQVMFNSFVKHPKPVDLKVVFWSFIDYDTTPWKHRWFLITLIWAMFIAPPVYKFVKNKIFATLALILLLFVYYMISFERFYDYNYFYFFTLNQHLIWFFIGIFVFKYEIWRYFDNYFTMVASWIIYGVLFYFFWHPRCHSVELLAMEAAGVIAMTSTSLILSRHCPNLFSSFRNYIFQIYILGISFQAFVELILWRAAGCPSSLFFPFYLLNILFGIYIPVIISKLIEKVPYEKFRWCWGLK